MEINKSLALHAMKAALESSHLVYKMVNHGKHEQDRIDAQKWQEDHSELLRMLSEMRTMGIGPWDNGKVNEMSDVNPDRSVGCYFCDAVVDERDTINADPYNENDGGEVCRSCQDKLKEVEV